MNSRAPPPRRLVCFRLSCDVCGGHSGTDDDPMVRLKYVYKGPQLGYKTCEEPRCVAAVDGWVAEARANDAFRTMRVLSLPHDAPLRVRRASGETTVCRTLEPDMWPPLRLLADGSIDITVTWQESGETKCKGAALADVLRLSDVSPVVDDSVVATAPHQELWAAALASAVRDAKESEEEGREETKSTA